MRAAEWYDSGSWLDWKGQRIFYKTEGTGPSLLCLHGFPTASWDFDPLWETLTSKFSVVAFDLIGLGRSAKPTIPISVGMQADIAESLLSELGIEQCHILAHDLGDTVAQELLARAAGDKYLSCCFLNGGLFPETHRPRPIQTLMISPLGPLLVPFMSERTFNKNMRQVFSPQHPPSDEFLSQSWELLASNKGKRMLPRLIRYMQERKSFRARWVGAVVDSPIPLRLINGVLDPVSGRHAAERYRELVPGSDIVLLEDCGHYPHTEHPEAVLEAFLDFHS